MSYRMNIFVGHQASDDVKLLTSIKEVVKNNGNVIQVFLRDTTTTSIKGRKIITEKEQKEIKKYIKNNDIKVFVHGSYLLNFCKIPVGLKRIEWAYRILAEDMELANKMGMEGVVIHMCTKKAVDKNWIPFTMDENETERKMVNHLIYFMKEYSDKFKKTKLILENSASEGNKIGGKLKSFGNVIRPLKKKYSNRIGVCIDTCHAFASGYKLNTKQGMIDFFDEYKKYVGPLKTITLIHLNDSETPLNSHKDRHACIGKGYIFKNKAGIEALLYLLELAGKNKIPLCLETHGDYKNELGILRNILKGGSKKILLSKFISLLEELKNYHQSLGNFREASQYDKAILSLQNSNIKNISSGNDIINLPWIGKGISDKANEFIQTNKIKILEKFKKDPKIKAYVELTSVFGIGPKLAKKIIEQKIYSVNSLKKSNFKLTKSQQTGLKYYQDLKKKIPKKEAEKLKNIIDKILNNKIETIIAGSYRTGKDKLGDIDIILVTDNNNILEKVTKELYNKNILVDSLVGNKIPVNKKIYLGVAKIDKYYRHVDIHIVSKEQLPFYLLYFGSGEKFSRLIRRYAKEKGYKLSNKSLKNKNNKEIPIKSEKDLFKKLNIKWIPPNKRRFISDIK
jgi:apurinic endonuclease APN1